MTAFYKIADIQHDTGKEIKYQRETHSQKGRVNKKQTDL